MFAQAFIVLLVSYVLVLRQEEQLPSVAFCPNYVASDIGFGTDRPNGSYPVATRQSEELTEIKEEEKQLVKVYSQGELIPVYVSKGRASSFEAYLYSWFPPETVDAIILDPPVIILGNGSEMSKDLALFLQEKGLVVPRVELSLVEQKQLGKTRENAKKGNGNEDKQKKKQEVPGSTKIRMVQCVQMKSGGESILLDSQLVSGAYFHYQIGSTLLWRDACFVSHGIKASSINEYLLCDLDLSGEGGGVQMQLFDRAEESSGVVKQASQSWTFLRQGYWADLSVRIAVFTDEMVLSIPGYVKHLLKSLAGFDDVVYVRETRSYEIVQHQQVPARESDAGKRITVSLRLAHPASRLDIGFITVAAVMLLALILK
jgi:hypothetical protein